MLNLQMRYIKEIRWLQKMIKHLLLYSISKLLNHQDKMELHKLFFNMKIQSFIEVSLCDIILKIQKNTVL